MATILQMAFPNASSCNKKCILIKISINFVPGEQIGLKIGYLKMKSDACNKQL